MDKDIIDAEAKAHGVMSDEWSFGFTVMDENNVPPPLLIARAQGADFQCTSLIGWIDLHDIPQFRIENTYRFRKPFRD